MQLGHLARHGHDPGHVLGFQQAVHQWGRTGGIRRGGITVAAGRRTFLRQHSEQKSGQHRAQFQQKIQNLHYIVRLTHKGNVQGADDFAVQDQGQGDGGVEPHTG